MKRMLFLFLILISCEEPEPVFHTSMMIGSWEVAGYKDDFGWHAYKARDYSHQTTELVFSQRRLDVFIYGARKAGATQRNGFIYDQEFHTPVTYADSSIIFDRFLYFEIGRLDNNISSKQPFYNQFKVTSYSHNKAYVTGDSLEYILKRIESRP